MTHEFTKGDIAYTNEGVQVEFICMANGQYLVYHMYEDYDGIGSVNNHIVYPYDKLFTSPPVLVKSKEVETLDKLLFEKRQELFELDVKIKSTQRDNAAILKNLKKHAALQYIDDVVEGRITHVVSVSFYDAVEVHELSSFIQSETRYDKGLKLLTLYGKTNGDLQFKISEYSDGSGNQSNVFLCPSKESATILATALLTETVSKMELELEKNPNHYVSESLLKSMTEFGVESKIIHDKILSRKKELIVKEIQKAQETLDSLNTSLEKLE